MGNGDVHKYDVDGIGDEVRGELQWERTGGEMMNDKSGQSHGWNVLTAMRCDGPFLPDRVRPWCVDLSTPEFQIIRTCAFRL